MTTGSARQCEHCNRFFTARHKNRPARFCSSECRNAFWKSRRQQTCTQCGQTFERKAYKANRSGERGKFCSMSCYALWQSQNMRVPRHERRGNHTKYGVEFLAQREHALNRDGHRCTQCGSTQRLNVHHINPVALGVDHSLSNLQTLCNPCHTHLHHTHRDEFRQEKKS